jgi:hypothetical protein
VGSIKKSKKLCGEKNSYWKWQLLIMFVGGKSFTKTGMPFLGITFLLFCVVHAPQAHI